MKVIAHKIKFKCYFPEEAFSELQKKNFPLKYPWCLLAEVVEGFFSFPLKMANTIST